MHIASRSSRPGCRTARALCAGLVSLASAIPASAQQVPADTLRDSATVLAPVRVAASRIAGEQAAAPYARSVRTAEELRRGTPALALDEALRGIPGVQVDNRFNYALGERISIRSAGARAQFGVRGVRVLVDGIPATLPDGQTTLNQLDLTTLSRVEVLRGPAASLFGNAAGGVILLETTPPPVAGSTVAATVMGGSHGLLRTRAVVGGARGAAGYSASVSRVAYDGYRTHSDASNLYGSATARWLGARDVVRATLNVVDYDARNPGSLSDSLLRVNRYEAYRNNVAQRTGESGAQQQGGLQWLRSSGAQQLEVTGWGIHRRISNPIPATVVAIDRLAGGLRVMHRGSAGVLAWTAGVEHERQHDDRQNHVNDAGEPGELTLDQDERVIGVGAFVQADVAVVDRVHLVAGLRHDRTRFAVTDRFVADGDPDDSGARTLSAASPSLGATLALPAGLRAYANVGTAFETPTTTELANRPDGAGGFNPALQPQRTVSWEAGVRRAGARFGAQLAAFRALVRDALIPFEVPEVPGRQYFRNAGRTAATGVEAAVSATALPRLRLDAAWTWTEARFREYAVGEAAFDGKRIPGVAPHRADVTATVTTPVGRVASDVRYQSRLPVNDANTAWSPAHTVADVRLESVALAAGRARVTLSGGVQNVFAARYNTSVVVNAFGRRYYEPGPERTFHLGATVTAR